MASLENVRIGMRVVDVTEEEIGTVEDVKMGDTEAVTAEGQVPDDGEKLTGGVQAAVDAGRVNPEHDDRMLRQGYLKIKTGILARDKYVAADDVDRVVDDVVHVGISLTD